LKIKGLNYLQKKYIPNIITISRLLLSFPIIIFLEINKLSFVWFLILIGGIFDYLDGYFAKKLNSKTRLGAILDPIVDKIFIIILFSWLSINNVIPYWSLCLIITREFLISSLRSTKDNGLPALKIAKSKTLFQFICLLFLFFPYFNNWTILIGLILYWIAFGLTFISIFNYLRIK